jgi:hypothetical protein
MNRRGSSALLGLGLLVISLIAAGCSALVPLGADNNFQAQQNVVLTLKDGRTVRGHIDPGRAVEYRSGKSTYRARVANVTGDAIELDEVTLIDQADSYHIWSERLADARVQAEPVLAPVTLSRTDVSKVELISFAPAKTLRETVFWGFSGMMFVLLLGQRS